MFLVVVMGDGVDRCRCVWGGFGIEFGGMDGGVEGY